MGITTSSESVPGPGSGRGAPASDGPRTAPAPEPRRDFSVSFVARQPSLAMPDEILDYYAWIFCQAGFANLRVTFEQFLMVVATLWPSRLRRGHGG
jgi:hypothetical protein